MGYKMATEQNELNYRFSGYQLPKVQLDDTFSYDCIKGIHPYYTSQPIYWQKPAYRANWAELGAGSSGSGRNNEIPVTPIEPAHVAETSCQLHCMLHF